MFLLSAASIPGTFKEWNLRAWAVVAPATFALLGGVVFFSRWVLARYGYRRGFRLFGEFLTLPEAENLVYGTELPEQPAPKASTPRSLPVSSAVLFTIGFLGTATWGAFATYQLKLEHATSDAPIVPEPLIYLLPWLYPTARAARYHDVTPPKDLFALYVMLLASSVSFMASAAYRWYTHIAPYALVEVFAHALELLLVVLALTVLLRMPILAPTLGMERVEVR